jgi:hypothetical protein
MKDDEPKRPDPSDDLKLLLPDDEVIEALAHAIADAAVRRLMERRRERAATASTTGDSPVAPG